MSGNWTEMNGETKVVGRLTIADIAEAITGAIVMVITFTILLIWG